MIELASFQAVGITLATQVHLIPLTVSVVRSSGVVDSFRVDGTSNVLLANEAIRGVVVYNSDTIAHVVTLNLSSLGVTTPLTNSRLKPGDRLEYSDGEWRRYDANGETSGQYFTSRLDQGATYTYIGQADPGTLESESAWQIKRMTNSNNTILFADGNANFDNVWTNRASLSYS